MSDRTYTRNELLHLDDFGPTTEVCRTNSNTWVEARRDPALASLFDEDDQVGTRERSMTETTSTIDFIPRYYRFLAGLTDLLVLAAIVFFVDLVTVGVDFHQRALFLLGFLIGAVSFTALESGLIDAKTPGKYLFGLRVVSMADGSYPLLFSFGRFCLTYGPILLLGVAFDPALPHDAITRYVSLSFAGIGFAVIFLNTHLFFFNDPTYRLGQDYLFKVWVLPDSTSMVPEAGFLRLNQVFSVSLTVVVALGAAFVAWEFFWSQKAPPLLDVPRECSRSTETKWLDDSVRRNELRKMLMSGRFTQLENRLDSLYTDYRDGRISDAYFDYALGSFAVMDRSVGRRINRWVISDPESVYALLARANYHLRRAQVHHDLLGEIESQGFESSLEQARISAQKALNLNNEIPSTYGILLELNRLEGKTDRNRAILSRSLKFDPPSVSVWHRALLTNDFRVRPEGDDLRAKLDQLRAGIPESASLNLFCGLPAHSIGDRYQSRGRHETAHKYYVQALSYGQAPWTRLRRSLNAFRMGSTRLAENEFSRALEGLSNRTEGLIARARIHFDQGAYSQALDALDLALDLEPAHPETLYLHARVLNQIGESQRAREQLRAAESIIPDWEPLNRLRKRTALAPGED